MTWGQAPEDGGDPGSGVTWKKGQKTWGRDMPEYVPGNPNDPTDPGSVKHNFTPISLEDEEMKARWGMGGGGSYEQHYTNLYTQTYPQGKSGKITDPVELQQEALDDYKLHNNTLPGQAILGAHIDAPQSKAEQEKEASSQQAKADDEAYTRLRKTKPGQSEEQSLQNDTIAWATAQNSADPNEKKAAGDDPFAYHTKMQQANQEHDAQMDTARASYLAQPASKRKGFVPYLLANGYDPKTRSFTQASQQPQIQNQGGTPGSDNNIYWDGKNYRKHSDGSIVQ
jgi:hypothetical protein